MTDWRTNLIDDDAGLAAILRDARTVAVVGAKTGTGEPSHYVPAYLRERGYRILPVNPKVVGTWPMSASSEAYWLGPEYAQRAK